MTQTITAAAVLDGHLPADATGVLFRRAKVMLCREHLGAEALGDWDNTEAGVVLHGFVDCDWCREVDGETLGDAPAWLNVGAIVPTELRDRVPELLGAAERMLDAVAGYVALLPELRAIEGAIAAARVPDGVPEAIERAIGVDAVRARAEAAGFCLHAIGSYLTNPGAVELERLGGEAGDTVAGVVRWMIEHQALEYLVPRRA